MRDSARERLREWKIITLRVRAVVGEIEKPECKRSKLMWVARVRDSGRERLREWKMQLHNFKFVFEFETCISNVLDVI